MSWNYPSWSISSEFFAYLLFPLMAAVFCRCNQTICAGLLVLACTLSMIVYSVDPELPFHGLLVVLPTFAGGAVLAVICPPSSSKVWRRRISEGLLIIIAVIPFIIENNPLRNFLLIFLFFALTASLGICGTNASSFWKIRPLVFLGELSYSLYMTHALTMTLESRFLPLGELGESSLLVRIGVVLGLLFLVLFAAMLMYYSVERPLRSLPVS